MDPLPGEAMPALGIFLTFLSGRSGPAEEATLRPSTAKFRLLPKKVVRNLSLVFVTQVQISLLRPSVSLLLPTFHRSVSL